MTSYIVASLYRLHRLQIYIGSLYRFKLTFKTSTVSVFKLIFPTEANKNHLFRNIYLYPISTCSCAYTSCRYIYYIERHVWDDMPLGRYYVGIFQQGVISANFSEILESVALKTFYNNELIRVYSTHCLFIRTSKRLQRVTLQKRFNHKNILDSIFIQK